MSEQIVFDLLKNNGININGLNNKILLSISDRKTKTETFFTWMKNQNDNIIMRYKLNCSIPHSLFNISCNFFKSEAIQNIDWFSIHKRINQLKWERDR